MDQVKKRKKIGFYNKEVIKMVPPLRQTILDDFQRDIKNGKYTKNDVPRF